MSDSESEDEKEYEVEKILDRKDEDSDGEDCLMYLVKWKGYDSDESTWEPDDALEDPMVREKIRKYNRKQARRAEEGYRPRSPPRSNFSEKERKKQSQRKREQDERLKEIRKNRASKGLNAYAGGQSSYKSSMSYQNAYSSSTSSHEKKFKKRALEKSRPAGDSAAKIKRMNPSGFREQIRSSALSTARRVPGPSADRINHPKPTHQVNQYSKPKLPSFNKKKEAPKDTYKTQLEKFNAEKKVEQKVDSNVDLDEW